MLEQYMKDVFIFYCNAVGWIVHILSFISNTFHYLLISPLVLPQDDLWFSAHRSALWVQPDKKIFNLGYSSTCILIIFNCFCVYLQYCPQWWIDWVTQKTRFVKEIVDENTNTSCYVICCTWNWATLICAWRLLMIHIYDEELMRGLRRIDNKLGCEGWKSISNELI